jgi:hypothetical protein
MNPFHSLTPYLYDYRETNTGNGLNPAEDEEENCIILRNFRVCKVYNSRLTSTPNNSSISGNNP